ncbi:type VI secretion system lipoprotein TssJ [Sulfitobacter sp. CW3]|uniref:type VI secretion system lipoprotein TssJ n=1 Tax=Sulfitobacter sp. CW3 TaxID=2861965 RepID=UPI001C604E5B|nr:type VI secretion system lipoprotein TssJ [Sulfitobacter sp. CW3]MBW4964209.1 type VI secretion system lipoprotein TssJ [Sulfitobacter sp. CW3]
MRTIQLGVCLCAALFALSACGDANKKKGPINKTIWVEAGPNVNQYNDSANPIVVRIYQLSSRTEFEAASFWGIFNNDAPDLAGAILDKRSLSPLYPGEKRLVAFDLQPDVFYLAAFAEFSNYETQQFKTVVPMSLDRLDNGVTISVASSGVSIQFRKSEDSKEDSERKPGFFSKLMAKLFKGGE